MLARAESFRVLHTHRESNLLLTPYQCGRTSAFQLCTCVHPSTYRSHQLYILSQSSSLFSRPVVDGKDPPTDIVQLCVQALQDRQSAKSRICTSLVRHPPWVAGWLRQIIIRLTCKCLQDQNGLIPRTSRASWLRLWVPAGSGTGPLCSSS